jgi:hypothetical protein
VEYHKKLSVQEQMERTRLVREELMEKYSNYEQTKKFISFIASTENLYSQAESEHWDTDTLEKKMIESEIYLMSVESGIDEDIFRAIYDDFRATEVSVQHIQIIAKELIEKYEACGVPCIEFINYLRDFILIFSHAHDDHSYTLDEQRADLVRARMRAIADQGAPDITVLEEIYAEFSRQLSYN